MLDQFQFPVKGKSTTQALVYLMHTILDHLETGGCLIWLFLPILQQALI
jgi:hypothetical protein